MRKGVLVLVSMALMVLLASGVAWAVNFIQCERGEEVCRGTEGNDWIEGTNYRDNIKGYGGNDEIGTGGGEMDVAYGGAGRDSIFAGDKEDRLHGGADRDDVRGGSGNDVLYGGDDADRINGDFGRDRLYGGGGNDFIATGSFGHWVEEEQGTVEIPDGRRDHVDCGAGRDTVSVEQTGKIKDAVEENCEHVLRFSGDSFTGD